MAIRRTGLLQFLASALLVVFSAATLAAAPDVKHQSCAAKRHDCAKTANVASRCCANEDQSAAQTVPARLREVPSSSLAGLCGFVKIAAVAPAPTRWTYIAGAPPAHPPDPLSLSMVLRL